MPVLSGRALSKAYGLRPLFVDADLTIRRGEKVALVGPNGAGKSTLLQVLGGLEPADSGTIDRRRGAAIAYLPQEPALDPARSPRELVREALSTWHQAKLRYDEVTAHIAAGDLSLSTEQAHLSEEVERLGGWSRDHELDETLDNLGVTDKDRPVGTMSGGEKRRVALAQILVARPDLAILDEPTNHLDTETVQWLEEYLQSEFKGAVLIVTHDRYVLDAVATRVLELEGGKLVEYTRRNDRLGAFADWLEQKAERIAHEERVEDNRQNFLRREVEWLRRGPQARTTKQKARIQRAEAALSVTGPREREKVDLDGLEEGASRLGGTILELHDVSLRLGALELLRGLTMHLAQGERVGVVGPNGVGKTSLLRVVAGELAPSSGEVVRGRQTKVAYFDQARARLEEGWSVFDNVAGREGAERSGAGPVTIADRAMTMRAYLELFLFDAHAQRRKVSALSGGERARVSLALTLKDGANLLLLDEPTNDLDIDTLGALEDMLERWPGCALIVSHDRFFLDRVATSILAMEGDGRATLYAGNWSSYHERKVELRAAVDAAAKASARARPSTPPVLAGAPKKLTYAERIELDGILDVIATAEARAAELEAKLSDPAVWSRPQEEGKQLRSDLEIATSEVARLVARWEDLEKRRE